MDRETTTITTPVGKQTLVLKTYLTGREKRDLTNVYLSGKIDFNAETQDVKGIDAGIIDKAQNLAWQTVVVSIDGKTENVVDTILDMRSDDFDFVVAEVNKITSPKITEEKKTI
jgi:hypothetical protein